MPPKFLLSLWPLIDKVLCKVYHIRPLRADGSGVLYVEVRRYKGPRIILADGSKVDQGDQIIELHLNNAWFKQRRELDVKAAELPWEILHSFSQDLGFLAERVSDRAFGGITALHGCSFLDAGARRLGFQVEDLPDSLWKRWAQFYLAGIVQIHYSGIGRADRWTELKEVWLSRAELLKRYGPQH